MEGGLKGKKGSGTRTMSYLASHFRDDVTVLNLHDLMTWRHYRK